jgi:hypothetical protein
MMSRYICMLLASTLFPGLFEDNISWLPSVRAWTLSSVTGSPRRSVSFVQSSDSSSRQTVSFQWRSTYLRYSENSDSERDASIATKTVTPTLSANRTVTSASSKASPAASNDTKSAESKSEDPLLSSPKPNLPLGIIWGRLIDTVEGTYESKLFY